MCDLKENCIRVLGIDQGLANTGYGVLEVNTETQEIRVIESGSISTKKDNKRQDEGLPKRINQIEEYYLDKIQRLQPQYIVTEDIFFGKFGVKEALYISGIIFNLSYKNNLQLIKYTPSEVKATVTKSGKSGKGNIIKAIKEQVQNTEHFIEEPDEETLTDKEKTRIKNIIKKQSHEADSIAIALTAILKDYKNKEKVKKPKKSKKKEVA